MAPRSTSWLAEPSHISYPIKAPPAHAFQLHSEIYWPGAGLIQQDAVGTKQQEQKRKRKKQQREQRQYAWEVDVIWDGRVSNEEVEMIYQYEAEIHSNWCLCTSLTDDI